MTLTVTDLTDFVGTTRAWIINNDVTVDVEVLSARQVFGRIDLLIEPVAGRGTTWVALTTTRPFRIVA